jgi:hypothetical protein
MSGEPLEEKGNFMSCYMTPDSARILLERYGFSNAQEVREAVRFTVNKASK